MCSRPLTFQDGRQRMQLSSFCNALFNPNLRRLELQIPFVDTNVAKILILSVDLVLLRTVPLTCVIRVSRLLPVRAARCNPQVPFLSRLLFFHFILVSFSHSANR